MIAQPSLGIPDRLAISRRLKVSRQATLAGQGIRTGKKPGFVLMPSDNHRQPYVRNDIACPRSNIAGEVHRAIIIGIQQDDDLTIPSLGGGEQQLSPKLILTPEELIPMNTDRHSYIQIKNSSRLCDATQQDGHGLHLAIALDDTDDAPHDSAPNSFN